LKEESNSQDVKFPQKILLGSNLILVAVTSILVTTIVVGVGVYAWQNTEYNVKEQTLNLKIFSLNRKVSNTNLITSTASSVSSVSASSSTNSSLKSVSQTSLASIPADDWNTYTSSKYSFSMKYPKTVYDIDGCGKTTSNVKVFEDTDSIYFAPEFVYLQVDKNCVKVDNSIRFINQNISYAYTSSFKIKFSTLTEDLSKYLASCNVSSPTNVLSNGSYRPNISGDNPICNSIYVYYPNRKLLATLPLLQSPIFTSAAPFPEDNRTQYYDSEMFASFKFN